MNEHNDQISFDPTRDYMIPGRVIKQLVRATQDTPQLSDRDLLLKFLDASGIPYDWEEYSCGDSSISQVWFHPPRGWELVFEFDSETGAYKGMELES